MSDYVTADWDRDDYPFPSQCVAIISPMSELLSRRCGRAASVTIGGNFPVCAKHRDEISGEADPSVTETYGEIALQLVQERRKVSDLNNQVRRLEAMVKKLAPLGIKENGLPVERPASYYSDRVYFIRCEDYIKIGKAQKPEMRLRQIRRGGIKFPKHLDLESAELVATELGSIDREQALHQQFAHLRHTGEWFTEAPELTDYINSLQEIPA